MDISSGNATKQSALKGLDAADLRGAIGGRYDEIGKMLRSSDFREGPRAFAEKRPPRWQGK